MKLLLILFIVLPFLVKSQDTVYTNPEFTGGDIEMMNFINNNFSYPEISQEMGHQGIVYIEFVVDSIGNVDSVKILKGVSKEIDAESIRVVELMPNWKPGTQDGKSVSVRYTMPIKVTLSGGGPWVDSPKYPGGENAMHLFIQNNFIYPELKKKKEGIVSVSFYIEKDGSLSNIEIKNGLHKLIKKEIIRVLKSMPKWDAGMYDQVKSRMKYHIEIPIKKPNNEN